MSEPKPDGKPFVISKRRGLGGLAKGQGQPRGCRGRRASRSQAFEANLRGNLYKLWNRLSSGSYIPPPVQSG